MTSNGFTIDDLMRALRTAAGTADPVELDTDPDQATFTDLGYDSVAVLELFSVIERELGLRLGDEAVAATTPAALVRYVNARLEERI